MTDFLINTAHQHIKQKHTEAHREDYDLNWNDDEI